MGIEIFSFATVLQSGERFRKQNIHLCTTGRARSSASITHAHNGCLGTWKEQYTADTGGRVKLTFANDLIYRWISAMNVPREVPGGTASSSEFPDWGERDKTEAVFCYEY
jgi:hypothetical protein